MRPVLLTTKVPNTKVSSARLAAVSVGASTMFTAPFTNDKDGKLNDVRSGLVVKYRPAPKVDDNSAESQRVPLPPPVLLTKRSAADPDIELRLLNFTVLSSGLPQMSSAAGADSDCNIGKLTLSKNGFAEIRLLPWLPSEVSRGRLRVVNEVCVICKACAMSASCGRLSETMMLPRTLRAVYTCTKFGKLRSVRTALSKNSMPSVEAMIACDTVVRLFRFTSAKNGLSSTRSEFPTVCKPGRASEAMEVLVTKIDPSTWANADALNCVVLGLLSTTLPETSLSDGKLMRE